MKLLSERETILEQIAHVHNQLRTMEITERLATRANMRGELTPDHQRKLGLTQAEIKRSKQIIQDLLEFLKDAKTESPLDKTLEPYYPKE